MNTSKYKYPIGIQTFSEIREGGYLYVDKTGYVHRLAQQFKFVFLSRPRRFGKSLLLSTMRSYFEGRRDLFEGLEAGRLETEWTQYPVLNISLASAKGGTVENLNEMVGLQLRLLEDKYGIERTANSLGARLQALIIGCAEKYGKKVVVLVDEYDAPLLTVMHQPERLEEMRLALRAFYSPLKDCDEWLRFVFITGISKFSQLSIFSELNNLKRITMVPEFSAVCGITEQELHEQWGDAVAEIAADIGVTTEEACRQLKKCCDGYHFAEDLTDVYNPFSLLNALVDRDLQAHWFETGTPTVLVNMLQKFNTDITRLEGSMARSTEFDAPIERMRSMLPLFYQSGYLTIKDYDRDTDTYTLGFPNNEVYQGMRALAVQG
ncbi:MAG: AAA family ATPase [Prevotella sp.]|nr:AAA family ATPase [Prevotella sp.]